MSVDNQFNYSDTNKMNDNKVKETQSIEKAESTIGESNKIETRSHNNKKQHDMNVNRFYI